MVVQQPENPSALKLLIIWKHFLFFFSVSSLVLHIKCVPLSVCNLLLSWSKVILQFGSNYPVWLEKEFFHEVSLLTVQLLSKTALVCLFSFFSIQPPIQIALLNLECCVERSLQSSKNNIKILEPLNWKKCHPMKPLGFGNSKRKAELGY